MGFPSFLLYFLLVLHLLPCSVYSCPSSFDCGAFGPIKFPFTNNTYAQCGLSTLSCQEPAPKVALGDEERPIQVSSIDDDAIQISDPMLKGLIDSKSCGFFSYVRPRNTGSISYTISPNLTFFRCITSSNPELENQMDKNFSVNYARYRGKGCPGHTVYYPNNTVPIPGSFPENCFPYELPVVSSFKDRNQSDPFLFLTSNFSVEYHVSKECHECHNRGGQCSRDAREFECLNERGRSHLRLILATVIPGVIVFACFLILIIRYRKKWRNCFSSYTIWRNTSSDPFSKEGLEEGSAYFGIPVFSYSELKEATHNFDPSKELGVGGFGTVYHDSGFRCTVKAIC